MDRPRDGARFETENAEDVRADLEVLSTLSRTIHLSNKRISERIKERCTRMTKVVAAMEQTQAKATKPTSKQPKEASNQYE
jgi:proteasome assembly chaperone (PAC2) family protein